MVKKLLLGHVFIEPTNFELERVKKEGGTSLNSIHQIFDKIFACISNFEKVLAIIPSSKSESSIKNKYVFLASKKIIE